MTPTSRVVTRAALWTAAALLVAWPGSAAGQSRVECERVRTGAAPDPDLHCIDLVPIPDLPGASAVARLLPAPSPFGVAVDRNGSHRYRVDLRVAGLPPADSLGHTRYAAWATTPLLRPVIPLGEVVDGRVTGEIALDRFLLLVTAESGPERSDWAGRIVLRGLSASNRVLPLDDPILLMGAGAGAARTEAHDAHGDHAGHGAGHEGGAGAWIPPPMDHTAFIPPGMMELRPSVTPYLPPAGPHPEARPRSEMRLADGDTIRLRAGYVTRTIGGQTLTMMAFEGQHPGPLLRVRQGASIVVEFENALEMPSAVHWHGLRLENASDGVPGVTQPAVAPGDSFRYRLDFPDPGLFWYHTHKREDIQQELGLFGNIVVESADPEWLGPADVEHVLLLDDFLLADEGPVQFGLEAPTHATMGRFGTLFLVDGREEPTLPVPVGSVARFLLTNASNTRTFNLSFGEGVRIKLVASDMGRFSREAWVESVVIAPAERYTVEVRFDEEGDHFLENRVLALDKMTGAFVPRVDALARIEAVGGETSGRADAAFETLREDLALAAEIASLEPRLDREPDRTLHLSMRAEDLPFTVMTMMRADSMYFHPVEWSSTMEEMNWVATGREVSWSFRDAETGRENMEMPLVFPDSGYALIRFVNDREVLHAMHHPIHLHGLRFLVAARNGVPNPNLVWKDTFLLPVGETADILVELSNPGSWMLHCHIAEHLESGMHAVFDVGATDSPPAHPMAEPSHRSH